MCGPWSCMFCFIKHISTWGMQRKNNKKTYLARDLRTPSLPLLPSRFIDIWRNFLTFSILHASVFRTFWIFLCLYFLFCLFFFLSLLYPQCTAQSTSSLRVHAFILFILKADNSDLITIHFISLLETILFLVDKHLPPCSKKYIFSFLMLSQFYVKTKQKTDVLPPALCLVTISFIVSI